MELSKLEAHAKHGDMGPYSKQISELIAIIRKQEAELSTRQSSADAVDAARYRWLRASHEAIDSYEDDEGNPLSEINPVGFTVFKPGKYVQLEPISCSEGELDATLDAAIAAQGGKGGAA